MKSNQCVKVAIEGQHIVGLIFIEKNSYIVNAVWEPNEGEIQ